MDSHLTAAHRSPPDVSRALALVLSLLLLVGVVAPVVAAQPKGPDAGQRDTPPRTPASAEIIPGQVIVKYRDGAVPEAARTHGLAVVAELGAPGKGVAQLISTAGRPVPEVVAELASDPGVEYAEPNYKVHLADEGSVAAVGVNDPQTGGQYSLDRMRVRDAWSLSTGASNVIAVLDTGVQFNHPDLAGRLLTGYDFVNGDTDASDDNGHGTWVSGIIAANANDGYGIAGISWSDRILPVKIMNGEGTGSTANLLAAIRWSADQGASVINMSVGGFPYSQAMQDAVNYAWGKGAVLVGAAGNNGVQENFYPASFDNVISVSATQPEDEFSNWSSWGPKVDVSAPGSSILTTNCYVCTYAGHNTWGSHTYISGTSFATPNVAGVVALMRARYPAYSPTQIVNLLFATVDDRGYPGYDVKYGRGRVNAYRALGASLGQPGTDAGDGLEGNNTLATARAITLGATTRPSIHPAGDVDVFAVDVPRAGRLDVRVSGVVDTRAYPWNRSGLPIDPIVELYTTAGTLITRVDNEWETGTELASVSVGGATRILVRISNWYANGNRAAYAITPSYVDTAAPTALVTFPASGANGVTRAVNPLAVFNEPVTNVSSSTMVLRDISSGSLVPASVSYDSSSRQARLAPSSPLAATRQYRFELTAGITDIAGNALTPSSLSFTTGVSVFIDINGNPFAGDIDWLAGAGITQGCGADRYCPADAVQRDQMASFLARAIGLPVATADYFTDDATNQHQANINRIAEAGVTLGCGAGLYCPSVSVNREQMASFLARALGLPGTTNDYFTDDEQSPHETDINRLAAAGVTLGCGPGIYCPGSVVTRDQMAAFLHRAFSSGH
jgi:type VII secretion-associated serine protease mycosin